MFFLFVVCLGIKKIFCSQNLTLTLLDATRWKVLSCLIDGRRVFPQNSIFRKNSFENVPKLTPKVMTALIFDLDFYQFFFFTPFLFYCVWVSKWWHGYLIHLILIINLFVDDKTLNLIRLGWAIALYRKSDTAWVLVLFCSFCLILLLSSSLWQLWFLLIFYYELLVLLIQRKNEIIFMSLWLPNIPWNGWSSYSMIINNKYMKFARYCLLNEQEKRNTGCLPVRQYS